MADTEQQADWVDVIYYIIILIFISRAFTNFETWLQERNLPTFSGKKSAVEVDTQVAKDSLAGVGERAKEETSFWSRFIKDKASDTRDGALEKASTLKGLTDRNGDGVTNLKDLLALSPRLAALASTLDTNRDGVVDEKDMRDVNGDGVINAKDLTDRNKDGVLDEFDLLDTNNDGVIDGKDVRDINGDGKIDTKDFPDINGDGVVDGDDARVAAENAKKARASGLYKLISKTGLVNSGEGIKTELKGLEDIDGDGKITLRDLFLQKDGVRGISNAIDANGDGALDTKDLRDVNNDGKLTVEDIADSNNDGIIDEYDLYDVNKDGVIDEKDVYDTNGDGVINTLDFPDVNGDGHVDAQDALFMASLIEKRKAGGDYQIIKRNEVAPEKTSTYGALGSLFGGDGVIGSFFGKLGTSLILWTLLPWLTVFFWIIFFVVASGIFLFTKKYKTLVADWTKIQDAFARQKNSSTTGSYATLRGKRVLIADFETSWKSIENMIASNEEHQWKLAIIQADSLMEAVFDALGFSGTMGDKLKQIEHGDLSSLDELWGFHKVRNELAHDHTKTLTQDEAVRNLLAIRKACADLGLL